MKRNFHLFRWFLACALLLGLATRAWAVVVLAPRPIGPPLPQAPQGTAVPAAPPNDVTVQKRPLGRAQGGGYILLTQPRDGFSPAMNLTLLIALHGAGDTADNFSKFWIELVKNHPGVVVAVPDYTEGGNMTSLVTTIINQTVARDHVNPKHVILAGYSAGGGAGSAVVGARPDLFAGFALIADAFTVNFFTPALKKSADKMPLFYAQGTKMEMSDAAFAFEVAQLKNFGFTNILAERPEAPHEIPLEAFNPMADHLMTFFEASLIAQDKKEKAPTFVVADANAPAPGKEPHWNVLADERTLTKPQGAYIFLKPDPANHPAAKDTTLLVCLHGLGDPAVVFVKKWMDLVNSRADVVVAVPESTPAYKGDPGYVWSQNAPTPADLVAAIIADTVTRDHVNPKRVILVGHDQGGAIASGILGARPDLFAGYAGIATDISTPSFTPTLQKLAGKIAVYYAVGTKDEMFTDVYASNLGQLKNFGFTNLLAEKPASGHDVTAEEITHMMGFFDRALTANAPQETAPAQTHTDVVVAQRTLQNPKGTYVFLTPNRQKFPAKKESTLLICLPGKDDPAANFAKQWVDLVDSRLDVVVAVPEFAPAPTAGSLYSGVNPTDLISAIIDDTVGRDDVNPKHVILVAYGEGGGPGGAAVGAHPESFAGYAGIATNFPPEFFTPALQDNVDSTQAFYTTGNRGQTVADLRPHPKMAVYYAVGKTDEIYKDDYAPTLKQLTDFGLYHLKSEQPDAGHVLTADEIAHLMKFFDQTLEQNDKKEDAATAKN